MPEDCGPRLITRCLALPFCFFPAFVGFCLFPGLMTFFIGIENGIGKNMRMAADQFVANAR
jgi:hypothetical protein